MAVTIPFISQPIDQAGQSTASRPWYLFWQNLASIAGATSASNSGVGSVAGITIVCITDSHGSQNALMPQSWPAVLQYELRNKGVPCNVVCCGADGMTFFRAMNAPTTPTPPPPATSYWGFGTNSAVQQAIAYQADIVIVALGGVDSWISPQPDGRTTTQVQADAALVFSTLRSGLPKAIIAYASEVWYDQNNYNNPGSSLANQGCLPYFWNLQTGAIANGLYNGETVTLTQQLPATYTPPTNGCLAAAGNWVALDAYIKTLTSAQGVDTSFPINYWRMARMGGLTYDGLHPVAAGMVVEAAYVMKGLKTATVSGGSLAFESLTPYIQTSNEAVWEDPDLLFTGAPPDSMFMAVGHAWSETFSTNSEAVKYAHNIGLKSPAWFMPNRGDVVVTEQSGAGSVGDTFSWVAFGCAENQKVYVSIDAAGFVDSGTTTSGLGNAASSITGFNLSIAAGGTGLHYYRYKIGNASYGPFPVIVQPLTPIGVAYNSPPWGDYAPYVGEYYRTADGEVFMDGAAAGGLGAPALIGTIPAGYRPDKPKVFVQLSNAGLGSIQVAVNGQITLLTGSPLSIGLVGHWHAFN